MTTGFVFRGDVFTTQLDVDKDGKYVVRIYKTQVFDDGDMVMKHKAETITDLCGALLDCVNELNDAAHTLLHDVGDLLAERRGEVRHSYDASKDGEDDF